MAKRHKVHKIIAVLPNHGDRDRSWTGQDLHSVEMCWDLVRATICEALSGPIAQCLSRVTHEEVRVDTRKCE